MGYRYEKFVKEDHNIINAQTLDSYAATNFAQITEGVKGVVIEFPDVDNNSRLLSEETATDFAALGIAYARVCTSPWDWGSAGAVRYADLTVDAIKEKFSLGESAPIVAYGKGMGAASALIYTADSRHKVSACAAEFPVTDMTKSLFLGEKKIPRTIVRTVYAYDMPIKDGLKEISPIEKLKDMPDIPYYIVGGTADEFADPETLEAFVCELKKVSDNVTFSKIDGADHGEISPYESAKTDSFLKKYATAADEKAQKKTCAEPKNVTAAVGGGVSAGKAYEKYAKADAELFTFENLSYFTRNNINHIEGEIKGIVMEFPGLGGSSCLGGLVNMGEYKTEFALRCAKQGILVMYMYCGPWSWGNKGVVRIADLVIDALKKHYDLPDDIPVVSTGGSMGGIGALNFTIGSRHNVVSCMTACPCYDIIGKYSSYSVNPNFPRTFLAAVYNYDLSLADALKSITPCENIEAMPKVPYYIVCNENDECFDDDGMKEFAKDMETAGLEVTLKYLPDTKHGEFTDEERASYQSFIIKSVLGE